MQFELAFAAPHEALRLYVREYVGWFERSTTKVCRRELPSGEVPLIINFGTRVRERKGGSSGEWHDYGTFTAGLHEAFTTVTADGPGHGMQVNFTAIGASLFYGRPLADLTNRTVELVDVLGSAATSLIARLYETSGWEARFTALDQEIASRIGAARRPPSAVRWACHELMNSRGRASIADLRRDIGWSERHFAVQFRDHVGLAPKAFARILRFHRAVKVLTNRLDAKLADVALECGYYDQAHFTRDFRTFAGISPSALLESRLPRGSGFRANP